MAMQLQDFIKGVDFTGLVAATGADYNNQIELAQPYQDAGGADGDGKGLILVTTDSALDTPVVPDPTVGGFGKWVRYLWVRIPHVSATNKNPLCYAWNQAAAVAVTYLRWLPLAVDPAISAEIAALKGPGWTSIMTVITCYNTANLALSRSMRYLQGSHNATLDTWAGVGSLGVSTVPSGGGEIKIASLFIECIVTDGYFIDHTLIPFEALISASGNRPFGVWINGDTIWISQENAVFSALKFGGVSQNIDKAKWRVFYRLHW